MTAPVVVAGGGLAGLSLAVALLDRRPEAAITILEPRARYPDDRTWCFWEVEPNAFPAAVARRWWHWRVATGAGTTTATATDHPYVRLRAAEVYHAALSRIARAPNAVLRTGVSVDAVHAGGVTTADGETVHASVVCDARPPGPVQASGHPLLWQVFAGARVRAAPGTFDPDTVELMDFRVPQAGDIRFRYVLPDSDRDALVELTAFTPHGPDPAPVADALPGAVADRAGHDAVETDREHGCLPMTTAPPPGSPPGVIPLGTRAGAPRPSTGYAFLPIQRHCAAVADGIAAGRPAPVPMRGLATRLLDRVFLDRLLADPGGAAALFHALAARVPGDALARFLMERPAPRDTLRVVTALPAGRFAGEAVRGLVLNKPRRPAMDAP